MKRKQGSGLVKRKEIKGGCGNKRGSGSRKGKAKEEGV